MPPKKISVQKKKNSENSTGSKTPTLPIDLSQIDFTLLLRDPITYAQNLTIKDLELLLLIFKDYYYNTDSPLVPDLVYDEIEDVLRERAPQSQVLTTVGSALLPSERKTDLPFPMPSQNKAKAQSGDLQKWLKKYPGPYVVSHKLDGISLMYYRTGGRTRLFTRGTTHEGQDVSHLLSLLDLGKPRPAVPADLDTVAIRGELIMPKATWEAHYADRYPNVRNWISGQVAHKTPQPENVARIQLVCYEVIHPRVKPSDQFKMLDSWQFHVAPYFLEGNLSEPKLLGRLMEAVEKGPYQIDGLIISQDKQTDIKSDGNPKSSLAFKSQMSEGARTIVQEVVWQVSKNGLLKPVVLIDPIFLSGATLSKASGINAKFIVDNSIGVGAEILVVRSGEVIPFITEVIIPAPEPDWPTSYDYEWTSSGIDLKLTKTAQKQGSAAYQEMALRKLIHLVKTLKIEHLGPGSLKKLVALGYLEPIEILNLSYEELYEGANLGVNARKMYNSLQKVLMVKGVHLAQLMDASGTFAGGIGTRKMKLVLTHIPDLLDRYETGNWEKLEIDLITIKGVGPETIPLIMTGLPSFLKFLAHLPPGTKILDWQSTDPLSTPASDQQLFANWRLIFTGLRPSQELQDLIEATGGQVANGVSGQLPVGHQQLVITKDLAATTGKISKARDLDVPILDTIDFKKKFKLTDLDWS